MSLIIDTYNVLHTVGVLPPEIAGVDREGLAELIGRSRYRHQRATLVCDGVPREDAPRGTVGGVSYRYAGADKTADDVISQIIQRSSSPRRLTIVSSDRAVLREARRRRCNTLRSEEFLEHLAEDHDTPKPPVPDASPKPPQGGADPRRYLPIELMREAESITEADVVPEAPTQGGSSSSTAGSGRGSEREPSPPDPGPARDAAAAPPPPPTPRPSFLPQDLIAEAESLICADAREQEEAKRQRAEQRARRERESEETALNDREDRPEKKSSVAPYRGVLPEELIAGAEALAGIDPDRLDADLEDRFADQGGPSEEDEPERTPTHMPDDVLAEAESLWNSGATDEPLPMRLSTPAEPPAPPQPSGEAGPSGPGSGVPRQPEPPKPDDAAKGGRKSCGKSRDRSRRNDQSSERGSDEPRRDDHASSPDRPRREHGR